MKQNVSTDENADVVERLQILRVFIDSDLVPIAEAELAIRSGENKPSKHENSTKSVEKRSRKSASLEKKYKNKTLRVVLFYLKYFTTILCLDLIQNPIGARLSNQRIRVF